MKTISILLVGALIFFLHSCENQDDDTKLNHTEISEIDSIVYNVYLIVQDNQIVEMKKIHQDSLVERIVIDYLDTIIQKTVYHYDTLIQKSLYYLNDQNYAKFSHDSLYTLNRFYKTYYEYDEEGYLIEEKNIPGYNYVDGQVDSVIYYYYVNNGNRYGRDVMIIPPNTHSTGSYTYKYTELLQTYDLTTFNNSFLGKPNLNLPESYGYQYILRAGDYDKHISYEYEIEDNIVGKRIDNIYELWGNDSVIHREVLYYQYN